MKRLKLKHAYHDAQIRAIRYSSDDVVVDLCGCCNPSPGSATLYFFGLRNFAEVRSALEMARQQNVKRGYIDEIIGIARHDERGVLLDLATAGAVHLDLHGLLET